MFVADEGKRDADSATDAARDHNSKRVLERHLEEGNAAASEVAAGVDPQPSRELGAEFVAVAGELMRDLAHEAAVKDRRHASREFRGELSVSRNAKFVLDNGWSISVRVPKRKARRRIHVPR